MEKIPWINDHFHQTPCKEWFQTDAVLRVSLGNFLFFTLLAIFMIGVKTQKDPRDKIHHGGSMMKVISWCLLVIFMFFLPNEIVSFYGAILKEETDKVSRNTNLRSFACDSLVYFVIVERSW